MKNGNQNQYISVFEGLAIKPKITVVICALNEEKNLHHVLPGIPKWVDEVLLIDGNSTDKTVEVAQQLYPLIRVLYQTGKGKGDALKIGIDAVQGGIIVTLDADGATDPAEMERFITPLLNGYDFAKGSRFLGSFPKKKPLYRILGNWIITLTFDLLFFCRYTDLCSGYNAFRKDKLEDIDLWSADGFENEPLINARLRKHNIKVIEIGHSDGGRIAGDVKESSWRQGFKAIKGIFRERFCD